MAHKTLISGTSYSVTGGLELIGGTGYAKKKGRALVNGTGYDIPFSSGIPIGTLPVGSVVKIGVNGKSYDFLVVNQGIPSNSSLYDSNCDGTWLLMKNIYNIYRFGQYSSYNTYDVSDIKPYLDGTFLNLVDENVRNAIMQVKIPYSAKDKKVHIGADGLQTKVFILSCYEVGFTTSDGSRYAEDGAKLEYFDEGTGTSANNKRIAELDGSKTIWWSRSTSHSAWDQGVLTILTSGSGGATTATNGEGIRPTFILPDTFPVIQKPGGTYSPAE